jgi:hypothetical protein
VTETPSNESTSIMGEALASYNKRPRTFRAGRRCHFESCTTVLSIYNSGDFCCSHDGYRSDGQGDPVLEDLIRTDDLVKSQAV